MQNFNKLTSLIDTAKKKNVKVLVVDIDKFIDEFDLNTEMSNLFIEKSALTAMAKGLGKTENEVLNEDIFPDNGSIISGDFGEVLYHLIYEKTYDLDFFHYRWRSKFHKNKSVPGTDLAGAKFEFDVTNPSINDTLYTIEVKSSWVAKNDLILQKGYESLKKDKNGRVGKSLFATLKRMKQINPASDTSKVERFLNMRDFPSYLEQMIVGIGIKEEIWNEACIKNLSIDKKFIPDDIVVVVMADPWRKIKGLFKV